MQSSLVGDILKCASKFVRGIAKGFEFYGVFENYDSNI